MCQFFRVLWYFFTFFVDFVFQCFDFLILLINLLLQIRDLLSELNVIFLWFLLKVFIYLFNFVPFREIYYLILDKSSSFCDYWIFNSYYLWLENYFVYSFISLSSFLLALSLFSDIIPFAMISKYLFICSVFNSLFSKRKFEISSKHYKWYELDAFYESFSLTFLFAFLSSVVK